MAIIQVLETFAGSPFLYQESTASAAFGIDVSSGDAVKLVTLATAGAVVSGTAQFTVNTTTNGNIQFAPNGTGDLELVNGSFLVDAGNIYMPAVTSTQGIYYINSSPFMHNYGSTTNVFLGDNAGNLTLSGGFNTVVGEGAGFSTTSGGLNSFFGTGSGFTISSGNGNCGFGCQSLPFVTTGSYNIGIGANFTSSPHVYGVLGQLVSGSNNIAIGNVDVNANGAGYNYTTSESNNIVIGGATVGTTGESNVMRLGTSGSGAGQVNTTYIAGIYDVNAGSIANVATVASTGQFGTAVITAGAGIVVTAAANTITIAGTGAGFTWHDVTGGSATMAAENGYIADSGSLTTLTLPANNAFGDTIKVVGKGAGGWKIVYTTGQNIIFGSSASTATTGDISSTNANDCVELICTTASASAPIFTVVSSVGNITVV